MGAVIAGVGNALPEQIVDNEYFNDLGLTDRWIVGRTGIHRRRRLRSGDKLSDLALQACRDALLDAETSADDIDFVVVATLTPDLVSPSMATELVSRVG